MKRYLSAFVVTMPTSSMLLVLAYLSKVCQRPRLMELSLALAVLFYLTRLSITVPVESSTTFERGEMKWNVSCEGELEIRDGRAYIR